MKNDRQKKIIELVTGREIETQEELQRYLTQDGFNVTQATVSRDIRELGLTKVSNGSGSYRYTVQQTSAASSAARTTEIRLRNRINHSLF